MNVSDLEQFIESLRSALVASGAKSVAQDLERMCQGLRPFHNLKIAEFTNFLAAAEEYARTGIVPTKGRARASAGARKTKTADPEAVRVAAQEMLSLYERAVSSDVGYGTIDEAVKKLDKGFNKEGVIQVAREMGIPGSFKTKKNALEEIRQKIAVRKESFQRTGF